MTVPPDNNGVYSDLALVTARVTNALSLAREHGQIEGERHKAWLIDNIVRCLTGSAYEEFVRVHNAGSDGSAGILKWDVGIPPHELEDRQK